MAPAQARRPLLKRLGEVPGSVRRARRHKHVGWERHSLFSTLAPTGSMEGEGRVPIRVGTQVLKLFASKGREARRAPHEERSQSEEPMAKTTALLLLLCLPQVSSSLQGDLQDDPIRALNFRPPAIPLFTTDPFTQTWMRGDNSTCPTRRGRFAPTAIGLRPPSF